MTRNKADDSKVSSDEHTATTDGGHVTIRRLKLASITDALDDERRTVERYDGEGSWTEMLSETVEECRSALSALDDDDEYGVISRTVAGRAATGLEVATKTETGDYAEKLQEMADTLRGTLEN